MTQEDCPPDSPRDIESNGAAMYARRHMRLGWWLLLTWLCLGIVLEAMHAYKVGWYLDASNATRHLMWRLAHAHGTLFGLLNIAFALTLLTVLREPSRSQAIASRCLAAAGLLLPAGFLLGGIDATGGDPGRGILLVPAGAILLLIAVALTAWNVQTKPVTDGFWPRRGRHKPDRWSS